MRKMRTATSLWDKFIVLEFDFQVREGDGLTYYFPSMFGGETIRGEGRRKMLGI